jgi:hypothetical protein
MSRIDELKKQHPTYALSAIDIYKMMSPNQSNKYIEMLIKLDKIKPQYSEVSRLELIEHMVGWGLDYNYLETLDLESLRMLLNNASYLMNDSNIKSFTKFASFIERKLIENNDVTTYSTWDEINQAISLAEVKLIDKETAKQIKKVYEDDEWLSLRPLSLEASMKYGANTKWCTTTNTGQYYARYSARGILIYNINKKTGYKVACFKNLDSNFDNEFSWWDVTDKKIEALDSEAPSAVLEAIRNEIKNTSVANKLLMTKAEADKLEMYKDGNYRPGKYSEGPGIDRAYRTGGIIEHVQSSGTTVNWNPSTGTNTLYTYNPGINTLDVNTTGTVGIGTINPTTQLQVNGDMAIDGDIVFRSGGEERLRLTSNGFEGVGTTSTQQYNHFEERPEGVSHTEMIRELTRSINGTNQSINEQVERRLFPELLEDDMRREAQQRLDDKMGAQLAAANERVAEKHLTFLENIEMGTLGIDTIQKMQRLAGIETLEQRLARLDNEREQIIANARRADNEDAEQWRAERKALLEEVNEAEQPVVHLSLWNKIKNTGKKLGRTFTNRSRRQIGALPMSVSARLEAVKQSQEL